MNSRGLPNPPKPTQAQCEALALDAAWNSAGSRRPKTMALSADDERTLTDAWQKAGHDEATRAAAKKAPPDPYAGMTPDQIADAKLRERYEAQEAAKRAKAFSERIDREVGDLLAEKVLSRRGYSA